MAKNDKNGQTAILTCDHLISIHQNIMTHSHKLLTEVKLGNNTLAVIFCHIACKFILTFVLILYDMGYKNRSSIIDTQLVDLNTPRQRHITELPMILRKKCFLERSALWNKIISEKSSSFDFFLSRCLFRNDFTPFLEHFKPDVTSQRELLSDSCSWHHFLEMLLWYIRLMKQLLSIMITKWVI